MNSELKKALEVLKSNCIKYKDNCHPCEFYHMDNRDYTCYLLDKIPEEYEPEECDLKELEVSTNE